MSQPHVLYRFYGDGDALLYIGITMNAPARFGQHRDDKPWWGDVVRIEMEHFESRAAVLEAERAAIITESPKHNVVHNMHRGAGRRRGFKQPLTEVGRMCEFRTRHGGFHLEPLRLLYETCCDVAGETEWESANARAEWVARHVAKHGGDVAITWYVEGATVIEWAEQLQPDMPWFGLYYFDVRDASTGERLSLADLPVIVKRWDEHRQDFGGFLTAESGWTPAPLQSSASVADIFMGAAVTA